MSLYCEYKTNLLKFFQLNHLFSHNRIQDRWTMSICTTPCNIDRVGVCGGVAGQGKHKILKW